MMSTTRDRLRAQGGVGIDDHGIRRRWLDELVAVGSIVTGSAKQSGGKRMHILLSAKCQS